MEFQLIVRILAKISFRTAHNKLPSRSSTIRRGLWSIVEGSNTGVLPLFPVIATGKKYRFKCKCMQENPEIDQRNRDLSRRDTFG